MSPVVLLGPQRLKPTLVQAVDALGVDGPIAAVTAGWQEREDEIDELSAHVGRPVRNLRLYRRGEDLFARDPEMLLAYGDLLDRLRQAQDLYRIRLGHAKEAARVLFSTEGDPGLLEEERAEAVDALREIDARHRERVRRAYAAFDAEWRASERPALAEHRAEVAEVLSRCAALAVAGGHVQVLLDRLRLFAVARAARDLPVFAWSGGAMVVSEVVVLFHDNPPQGAGDPEVLGPGLGLCRGVLPLPHARRRLRLDDAQRVALLARRFAPLRCLALDDETRAVWDPRAGVVSVAARELLPDGRVLDRTAP